MAEILHPALGCRTAFEKKFSWALNAFRSHWDSNRGRYVNIPSKDRVADNAPMVNEAFKSFLHGWDCCNALTPLEWVEQHHQEN